MYRKGVLGVVINKDKKFLILYRKLHWRGWEFPKGGINKGEKEDEALSREVEEETGLHVRIICKLSYLITYHYPKDFIKKTKTEYKGAHQSVYLAFANGRVKLSQEHSKFRWVSYKEACKLLKHRTQKKALDVAYQYVL